MKYQLYLITNNVNGKRYVGQTKESIGYIERFRQHCKYSKEENANNRLYASMRHYGVDNFSVKLLMHDIDECKIDFYEKLWIAKLDTFYTNGHGYNMTLGGQGVHGYRFTEESKKRMSDKFKNWWKSIRNTEKYNQICLERSNRLKNREFSMQHRKRLSEAASRRVGDLNPFYGKKHSQEIIDIIVDKNSVRIGMFSMSGELIREFSSIKNASRFLNESGITKNKYAESRICKICRGIDKSAYGYIWKYL